MIEIILGKYNYWIYIALMMIGFYAMIAKENLVKKILGMNIFQTGVILLYVSVSKVAGGTVPILWDKAKLYDNPLPHVLMLTAIVVSVSTTAVALALIIRIYKSYGTIEDDQIVDINNNTGNLEVPSETEGSA
ncbi:Na(+) H(+) antiporter subunit C [hydrothermal vent metagenome]|uniref:Na(+) H(+) antiporter subunit C n=1 Tax=hydrothermal vent metagenome TaxID=652676 RepID=A0A3B0V7F2_9ZZZZ